MRRVLRVCGSGGGPVSTDHPRILDVDLSVLTDKTEPCPRCHNLPHGPEAPLECEDGRVPSPSWMPWKPTPCPTCDGFGYTTKLRARDAHHPTCLGCAGSGLVVPQEGDRILWQVEEWRTIYQDCVTAWKPWESRPVVPSASVQTRRRTVAVSTVHQALPIIGTSEAYDDVKPPCFERDGDTLTLWDAPDYWSNESEEHDLSALLDGPWGEQWTPGNVALQVTTEVLG
jgi:hypothetical protein